jgi:hypothetical protein
VVASSIVPKSLAASVKTKRIVIGSATGSCKPGKTARIQFKLNARGVQALRKLRTMNVRLRVTLRAHGTGGTTRTITRAVTIKMPPMKKTTKRAAVSTLAL